MACQNNVPIIAGVSMEIDDDIMEQIVEYEAEYTDNVACRTYIINDERKIIPHTYSTGFVKWLVERINNGSTTEETTE